MGGVRSCDAPPSLSAATRKVATARAPHERQMSTRRCSPFFWPAHEVSGGPKWQRVQRNMGATFILCRVRVSASKLGMCKPVLFVGRVVRVAHGPLPVSGG